MKHSAWFRMAFLLLVAAGALVSPIAEATTVHVTSTDDVLDPNDGLCTLREAVRLPYLTSPSAVPGECASPGDNSAPYEIILPGGTFDLSIPGQLEDEALTGDLDIKSLAHTTIRGRGPS